MDESAEVGALREMQEETGWEGTDIRQIHAFSYPLHDSRGRVITIAYYAVVRLQEVKGSGDAADARWFVLDALPPLVFDHEEIIRKAQAASRQQVHIEPIGSTFLPIASTIQERQNLYAAILDDQGDSYKRNDQLKL